MDKYKVEKIQNIAQGLCGIAEVLQHNQHSKDLGKDYENYVDLDRPIEIWLLIALNHLTMEINGLTEDLHEYDFVARSKDAK